jgi:nitroreductase
MTGKKPSVHSHGSFTTDEALLEGMRRRRVTRAFHDEPVAVGDLHQILLAARWAPSAGNRRIHRYLVIRNSETVARLRPFAPGILGSPPALIVISTDQERARAENVQLGRDMNSWIDVGTAMMSMMLAADALGLGSCPATSFSQSAVARVLGFPATLVPELILQVGRPATRPRHRSRGLQPTTADLTDWEYLGQAEPAAAEATGSVRVKSSDSTIQSTR